MLMLQGYGVLIFSFKMKTASIIHSFIHSPTNIYGETLVRNWILSGAGF